MPRPIILPDLGAPGPVLSVWFVSPGDMVYAGDRVVEISVAGATFDVTAPVTGTFAERWAWPDDRLAPGQTLGLIDESCS